MLIAAASVLAQAAQSPAGGAATSEVIVATAGALVLTTLLLGAVAAYRAGRLPIVGRMSNLAERVTGLPGWAALPGTFLAGTLIIAVFGMYWDISLHIDNGRDPGPLANPAHYFILAGLFGVLMAGVLGAALERSSTITSLEFARGWHAPVGAVMITACGALSLSAFPLDDIWHRIFGQDVTLWSPTHLMLITGASLSMLGAWALQVEGAEERAGRDQPLPTWTRVREVAIAGAFLVGLSTFQAEFDFSVPQFALAEHPILLMLASGIALVAARIRIGRGGALACALMFIAIRGGLTLAVGPVLGQTMPVFPLYLAEALVVEAVALVLARRGEPSAWPVGFGLVAGLAVGTVGLAGEWAWSRIWMQIPWPPALFPEGAVLGFVAAVAASVVGGFIGRALTPSAPRQESAPRAALWAAAAALVAVVALPLFVIGSDGTRASLALWDVGGPGGRAVVGSVRVQPPDAIDDLMWFNVTSWQGGPGTRSQVTDLRPTGAPGTYLIVDRVPVHGQWKSLLRLHDGRQIASVAIFLPRDPAIPAPEVPAQSGVTRAFILDKRNLQREQKQGVPAWLTTVSYLAVGGLSIGLVLLNAWGLGRLERRLRPPGGTAPAVGAAEPAAEGGPGRTRLRPA